MKWKVSLDGDVRHKGPRNDEGDATSSSGAWNGQGAVAGRSEILAYGFISRLKPRFADGKDVNVVVADEGVDGRALLPAGTETLGIEGGQGQ